MAEPVEFVYRLPGSPGGSRPGAHRSFHMGPGLSFAGHARLFDQPDPRRLDLRASLRSARREWLVHTHRQRSAINIQVIVDVSASMHFGSSGACKLDVAADLVESLGTSAFRQGDAVGMSGFDHRVRADLFHPPRISRGIGSSLASRLRGCVQSGTGAGVAARSGNRSQKLWKDVRSWRRPEKWRAASVPGPAASPVALNQCIRQLASRSALVLLISDFHFALDELPATLARLSPACVVPLVLWDRAETEPPASTRWMTTRDVETGEHHSLWLTAASREAWRSGVRERRVQLRTLCARQDCHPFFIEDGFDADALSRHFIETIV